MPLRAHPELSAAALLANSDSLVGPVRVPEGFSVFTVTGIRERDTRKALRASDVTRGVLETCRALTIERRLDLYVAELATKYGTELFYDNLARVSVSPVQMYTRRYMGFGGVMTAYPMMYRLDGWVNDWKGRRSAVP